ncbi:hypothetical protein V8G54_035606 [Vigna mungo]|uniref:Uncharacterized protein n=1 Tax=Vigna mungo TaxID=3915 RepID=A0AAQ3MFL6_VIGMU
MAAASASATSLFLPSSFKLNAPTKNSDTLRFPLLNRRSNSFRIAASVSVSNPNVRTGPDDLVASILSKSGMWYTVHGQHHLEVAIGVQLGVFSSTQRKWFKQSRLLIL